MSQSEAHVSNRPVRSYILRVVEQRTLTMSPLYELHEIASGAKSSFKSLEALKRHLGQPGRKR